jgi:hypothetical protein
MPKHPPELSGFGLRLYPRGMHVAYLTVTILAVLTNGCAASMNLVGAKFVKVASPDGGFPTPVRWW